MVTHEFPAGAASSLEQASNLHTDIHTYINTYIQSLVLPFEVLHEALKHDRARLSEHDDWLNDQPLERGISLRARLLFNLRAKREFLCTAAMVTKHIH